VHKDAALVSVNAATGQVLASVSVPGAGGFNLALEGLFPSGSSFKVRTSATRRWTWPWWRLSIRTARIVSGAR
jgi:hypothetical protein